MAARCSFRHRITVVLMIVAGLAVAPGFAGAHTDFDYSLPTDGASVGMPVDEITVAFTLPVTLVGNGFTVLDPQNNELEPFAVTDDDTVFRLQFDPPLAGGTVAVKYEVRAEDGHVLTGNFVFAVDAPVPTTAPPTVPPTPVPPSTVSSSPSSTATATVSPTDAPTTTDANVAPTTPVSVTPTSVDATDGDGGSGNGMLIVIAAAVALAAGGFVLVRSRTAV